VAELIVALDTPDLGRALELFAAVQGSTDFVKVGLELFSRVGPKAVEKLAAAGARVFLDLKFHDIPNTVAGAVRAVRDSGAAMTTVHALGGRAMLEAAVAAADDAVAVVAVTVLTSLTARDLAAVGVEEAPEAAALRLARLAEAAGAYGVVASPLELLALRRHCGRLRLITPGVRPRGAAAGDQARVATPGEAVRLGADLLVVGRPITGAADPGAACASIRREMEEGA
jgi:orotidine-5'-phosphate decarboxylase